MDYKDMIGILTLVIAAISYSLYFRGIFAGHTKPHAVTWLVSAMIAGVTFATQRSNGAGAGGWVTGFAALMCGLIFLVSLSRGEKNITRLDWYCLFIALVAIFLWFKSAGTISVILASLAFSVGFIPTFRKSKRKPHQETAITFALNGTKFLIALAALDAVTLSTALYPIVVAIMNLSLVAYLLIRRGVKLSYASR